MSETDRMRAEFEAWAVTERCYIIERSSESGHYLDMATRVAWGAWQAACSAQARRDVEICESLRHMPAYTRTDGLQITRSADAIECAQAIKEEAGL